MSYKILSVCAVAVLTQSTLVSPLYASIPKQKLGKVSDDSALYESLSEIRVPRAKSPDFDADLMRLSNSQRRYKEKLPALSENPRLKGPMGRISAQKYRYSGG